jgi:hypothetical protein
MTIELDQEHEEWMTIAETDKATIDRLHARIAELEAALEDIIDYDMIMLTEDFDSSVVKRREIARRALERDV